MRTNVAIPSGAIYPDGLGLTLANPDVQASVRPEGQYFVKSVGFETIRPGRSRFQHSHGMGIHFTPLRFAENVATMDDLPLLVDVTTAADHADVADVPGSDRLDEVGNLSGEEVAARGGVLMSESNQMAPVGGRVEHRGTKTLPDMGDREPHRPLSQVFHGLGHPFATFKQEYATHPLTAVAAAGVVVVLAYMVGRDFERSYRSRERAASRGGGVVSNAAPVAAAPAAAADTSGNVVEKAADAVVETVETVVDAASAVVETATDAVSDVADTAADAVTS